MRRDDAWLVDMLQAAREAVEFANGLSFAEFEQNRMVQLALFAALKSSVKRRGVLLPCFERKILKFRGMKSEEMRNQMIHRYDDIDMAIVWETVQQDIPRLISQLERLAPPES